MLALKLFLTSLIPFVVYGILHKNPSHFLDDGTVPVETFQEAKSWLAVLTVGLWLASILALIWRGGIR